MNINDLKQSKYLKQSDVTPPVLATIDRLNRENVAPEGDEEIKPVLYFSGDLKPFVVNWTNLQLIAEFLGEETDDWAGKQIVLFNDPNVSYAGKRTGGIRVRAPKGTKPVQEDPTPF